MIDRTCINYKTTKRKRFDYEQIPLGYYDAVFLREKGVQSKWHQIKFARLRTYLKGLTYHLDIGCGPGTFIGTLGEGHLSVGIDISDSQIDYARKRYGTFNKRFERIDGDLELFRDGQFDVVTVIELVEHLLPEQNERLLQEASRVLRPGGRLVVSTPNYGGLWPKVESLVNRLGRISYSDQHVTHFTRASLHELLGRFGLNNVSVSTYMFVAPFMACLGWRFADMIERLEPEVITSRWGLLLLGLGTKPS
jgi:SAM-dependent methyltransferase